MRRKLQIVGLVLLNFPVLLSAQGDPMMGTWKLNPAKSNLPPDRQRNIVRKHEPIPGGIRVSWEGIDDAGKPTRWGFEAKFDGKDYPSVGETVFDALAMERPDTYTILGRSKKDGKLAVEFRWEVSRDGKTLTRTNKRLLPLERAGTSIEIFEKQ
jgi:hypothetical protein